MDENDENDEIPMLLMVAMMINIVVVAEVMNVNVMVVMIAEPPLNHVRRMFIYHDGRKICPLIMIMLMTMMITIIMITMIPPTPTLMVIPPMKLVVRVVAVDHQRNHRMEMAPLIMHSNMTNLVARFRV